MSKSETRIIGYICTGTDYLKLSQFFFTEHIREGWLEDKTGIWTPLCLKSDADKLQSDLEQANIDWEVLASDYRKHKKRITELKEMLRWYVEEDEIHEGDPENQYWIDGKHKAMKLLGMEVEE